MNAPRDAIQNEKDNQTRSRHDGGPKTSSFDPSNCDEPASSLRNRGNTVRPVCTNNEDQLELGWKDRIRHFTWTWFTQTMATGGIAAVIYNIPDPLRFHGLYTIGLVFMMIGICFFIMNCICISLRFYYWPKTLATSIRHPTESLFVPAIIISLAVILTNVTQYGLSSRAVGYWLTITMDVFYWIYIALAVMFSSGIFLIIWSTQYFTIAEMTPVWIFPAYPLLLAGPFASVLSDPITGRTGDSALRIVVSGTMVQGIGFMVSFMVYSAYLYRLMTQKLPPERLRPGMFISVGPSGFTIIALIDMGKNFSEIMPQASPGFMGNGALAGSVTRIIASWTGIWLYGLAIWFFFVSVGAHWSCIHQNSRLPFAMVWNSYIFPNTALAMATFAIARALSGNRVIEIIGCAMTIALVITWLFVNIMAVRAVIKKQILWPGKQEDRDADTWNPDLAAGLAAGQLPNANKV